MEVRCTIRTAGCSKNTHSCTSVSASPTLYFLFLLPKSTPAGDVVMCDPLRWRALRWGLLLTHRCDRGFTLSISSSTTGVCWSSCLSHLRPSTPAPRKVKDAGEMVFVLPSWHASTAGLKEQTTALWGKYGSCLFYVVVAVLLSDFFRPSLISHAWRCLKDELHHGGKIWRLFLVMLWLLLLTFLRSQDHARTLCRNQHIHLEEVVCVCYRQDSCSSFIEYYQNINGTLLLLYKLLY